MSVEVGSAADVVWKIVGNFNGMPDWHPLVRGSVLEPSEGGVGRRLTIGGTAPATGSSSNGSCPSMPQRGSTHTLSLLGPCLSRTTSGGSAWCRSEQDGVRSSIVGGTSPELGGWNPRRVTASARSTRPRSTISWSSSERSAVRTSTGRGPGGPRLVTAWVDFPGASTSQYPRTAGRSPPSRMAGPRSWPC